ncbi:MAG: hypothetical protein IJ561_05005 [Ruminococcus sp.]|nr:hypothetical protein [Ruminococcus sp.]
MEKIFYVTRNGAAPDMNRFARIEKLNRLLEVGWTIKSYVNENDSEFFVLVRD